MSENQSENQSADNIAASGNQNTVFIGPQLFSTNNKLIVEAYKNEGLKTETKNGFAFVQQKVSVAALKVLIDARLSDGTIIRAGTIAYIDESLLMGPAGKKVLESKVLPVPYLKIDISHVEFFGA